MARDFIYVDSDKVKQTLKNVLEMGEGDMSGNKLGLSSKIVPTVNLNQVPQYKSDVLFTQTLVQNTWYNMFPTQYNCRIIAIAYKMDAADETIEMLMTTSDGQTILGTFAAVAATEYNAILTNWSEDGLALTQVATGELSRSFLIEDKSIQISVRKTTALGANDFHAAVAWMQF